MIPLLLSLVALVQSPLTQEELWATDLALYHSTEVWYYKAPLDASLSLPEEILAVDADAPLHVQLAIWGSAPKPTISPGHIFGIATGTLPRAVVTFSPGASVGKGVYEWRADTCNPSLTQSQNIDGGWVEGAAAANGISRSDESEAATANDLVRNKSKPIVLTQFVEGSLAAGTGIIAMKVVTASSAWGIGFYVGSLVAGKFVDYWKSVTVPTFNTRFDSKKFLDGPYLLGPGQCVRPVPIFFSRTGGTLPVANVPIY